MTEHIAVVDEEYRWRGTTKHRPKNETSYAALCMACALTFFDNNRVRIRNWAKDHRCGETP